eukprot:1151352-Pelagomonas_calceolata.AAC.3
MQAGSICKRRCENFHPLLVSEHAGRALQMLSCCDAGSGHINSPSQITSCIWIDLPSRRSGGAAAHAGAGVAGVQQGCVRDRRADGTVVGTGLGGALACPPCPTLCAPLSRCLWILPLAHWPPGVVHTRSCFVLHPYYLGCWCCSVLEQIECDTSFECKPSTSQLQEMRSGSCSTMMLVD